MNELEVTELLLRAILEQSDPTLRAAMIHKLWANRDPQAIATCIDKLVAQGHSRSSIDATLRPYRPH